jgi:branched-chain amino acid transport system substrate-binding protein
MERVGGKAMTKAPTKALKKAILVPLVLVLVAAGALAADRTQKSPAEGADWIPLDDAKLQEVLAKIEAAGAYDIPDLDLRKDPNYANTSVDVEPFGGTKPFKENFLSQLTYWGAGRAKPEPEGLSTVKVGFIGPIMQTVSVATGGKSHEEALGIPMLQGSRLAIEEWNARGGYLRRRIPFELVVSNDNGLWGSSGNEIIKQAYTDGVWGMLGTIDGANSHIAIRVALKAELVMINSGDTDPTFIETNIPWVVRVIGDDRQQTYLLTDYWYRKLGLKRVAIIRASNRYGRFGVREIRDSARRMGRPVPIEMAYKVGQKDFRLEVERVKNSNPDAVVHWGDAVEGALVLNTMREMGMTQPFFGCDRTVSEDFVKIAGRNAEGVVATYPWDPTRTSARLARFRKAYKERYGVEAGTYAAHAYDGMNLLLWSIQVAGLNRAKIRDVIAHMPHPWPGVTGDILLSACLDDVGETTLARFEGGRWSFKTRAAMQVPQGYVPPRDRLNRDSEAAKSAATKPAAYGSAPTR